MCAEPPPAATPASNWVDLGRALPPLVHELRNVLAALAMALELADARLQAAGAAGPSLCLAAAPVVAHANALLADLLALTRPPQVRCGAFDLQQLVAEVANTRHRTGPTHAAPASTPTPPAPAPSLRLPARAVAFGNAEATATALGHVLRNAHEARATYAGRVAVELNEGERGWEVHVLDDGAGVADEVRSQLFAPFVSAKRRHLGLGLTHAWRHMRAQRGALELTDRAVHRFGRGASFRLTVPRDDAAAPSSP